MGKKAGYFTKNIFFTVKGFWKLAGKATPANYLRKIVGKVLINNKGTLRMGHRVSLFAKPLPISITVSPKAELTIGHHTFINYGVDIGATLNIYIGEHVRIGPLTNIIDSNFHQVEPHAPIFQKPVKIEDNVWIGRQCIILPGVTIGKNSVIASGSVVTKDIPENVLAAGVPATVKRTLKIEENWLRK